MKHALPSLFLLILGACGQGPGASDIPAAAKTAFGQRFPDVHLVKWETEDTNYEANFTQHGTHWSAVFSATGAWMETEHVIPMEALPEAVRGAIASQYAGHELKKAEQADSPQGTHYEVDLKKGGHKMEVVFSADGSVVKTEMGNEDGEEDESDEKD